MSSEKMGKRTIKAIVFDYGGVIEGKPNPDFLLNMSRILDIDYEICKEVYLKNNYLFHVEGLAFEELWKKLLVQFGRTEKEKEMIDFLRTEHNKDINQDLIDLIKILRKNGYKTGILSNNLTEVNQDIKNFGIDKFFDVILISEDIGYRKPDPKAFKILLEKLAIKPKELVFIDDNESSLSTAKEIGYYPLLYINNGKLKEELFSILN